MTTTVKELLGQARLDLESAQSVYDCAPACFFSQQAAEKYLKAYLSSRLVPFRKTHDLLELLALCETTDCEFSALRPDAELLKPFAVEVRYSAAAVALAKQLASRVMEASWRIHEFVVGRLPTELRGLDEAPR